MNKEDYYKRIEDKMDKQTNMLISIKEGVSEEFSLLKLAHQKLKYGTMGLAILVMLLVATEYPKVALVLKKII